MTAPAADTFLLALEERDAEIEALRAERDRLRSLVLATASTPEGMAALLAGGPGKSGSEEKEAMTSLADYRIEGLKP